MENRFRLETPENIELDFELAGLGSRFCAIAVDGLIQTLFLLIVLVVLLFANPELFPNPDNFDPAAGKLGFSSWIQAILLVFILVTLYGGYPLLFELLMRGQTPGKRFFRIRAISEDGTPMTTGQTLTRNLIRLLDMMPMFYLVGGVFSFFHSMHRRLGDLASGTIVVKERELDYRAKTDRSSVAPHLELSAINPELSADERNVMIAFLSRRNEIFDEVRIDFARRLATFAYAKYGGSKWKPERYLDRLLQGKHYESSSPDAGTQGRMGALPEDPRPGV